MKSLWKWCTVAVAVALFVVWGGQAQDSGWKVEALVQGADAANQRVIEMDVAVGPDGAVYVSYINQAETAVKLVKIDKAGTKTQAEIKRDNRVEGTTAAVDDTLVCVGWEEMAGVFEVWQACWNTADLSVKKEPWRLSTEEIVAGQANGAGWNEFASNFDNAFSADGKLYAVWSEDYAKLMAAKYIKADDKTEACGDIAPPPNYPDPAIRYPTIIVDDAGGVWMASADLGSKPEVWIWYSSDQCATWKGPINSSTNTGYSDGPGIARLGDKIYQVNDDDDGAAAGTADIHVNTCDATPDGAANCKKSVVYKEGGFPHIATDGKGLYVASTNGTVVKYGYSCDAGATWKEDPINNKYNTGYRDGDFGAVVTRMRVATGKGSDNVYVTWFWRNEGKSNIMLGTRPKDCK